MKKSLFKWGSICLLLAICILCVKLYSNINTPTPPIIDDAPVVSVPKDEIVVTDFPKAPLLTPFLGCEYLLPLTGSGKDEIVDIYDTGEYIYAFGNTTSPDYDFVVADDSVFVAKITHGGVLISTTTIVGSFIDAKVVPNFIIVASSRDNDLYITVFDSNLLVLSSHSFTNTSIAKCSIYLDGFCVVTHNKILFFDTRDLSFSDISLDTTITQIKSLECINGTLYIVAQTSTTTTLISVDDGAINYCDIPNIDNIHSATPFYDKGFGFVISGESGDKSMVVSVYADGVVNWTRTFDKGVSTVIPTDEGYILFITDGDSSICIGLCSHGDITNVTISYYSNLYPISWQFDGDSTYLLLYSLSQQKSVVSNFSVKGGAFINYEFFSTTPCAFSLTNGRLTLGITCAKKVGNFFSGKGGVDSYILRLTP